MDEEAQGMMNTYTLVMEGICKVIIYCTLISDDSYLDIVESVQQHLISTH